MGLDFASPPKAVAPWRPHPATVLAWLVMLPLLVALGRSSAVIEDEFLSIGHAVEAMQGVVLYRDRFEFTAPLSHWALILLVPLGSGPLATSHALLALVVAWVAEQLRRIALTLGLGPWLAALVAVAWVASPLRLWPGWSHHWAVWPWLLWQWWLAALALKRESEGRSASWHWWGIGLCWALAFVSLQPDGALVGLALASVAWAGAFALRPGSWDAVKRAAQVAGGGLVVLGLVLALWGLQGALAGAIEGTILFPFTGYKQAGGINDLPWFSDLAGRLQSGGRGWGWALRSANLVGLYAAVLLLPWAVLVLGWALGPVWPGRWPWQRWALALPVAAACASAVVALAGRADAVHVATSSPPAVVLLGLLVAWCWRQAWGWGRRLPAVLMALWVGVGLAWWGAEWRANPEVWRPWPSPDARVQAHPALRWLAQRLGPGDRLVALPYAGLYVSYLAPSASRWLLLFPPAWGYNSPSDWALHWAEVARLQPACVLVTPWPPLKAKGVGPWVAGLPKGYRLVAELPPLHPSWGVPLLVYGRPGWPHGLHQRPKPLP